MQDFNFTNGAEFLAYNDNFAKDAHIGSTLIFSQENLCENDEVVFSIAIPTYRRIDTLKEAIDSALCQEYKGHYEILVIENPAPNPELSNASQNSKDSALNTPVSEFLKANYYGKLTYYQNAANLGLFGNFNRAISLARGQWVCILHDDDVLLPHYLRTMCEILPQIPPNTALISHRAIYFGNLALIGYAHPPRDSHHKAFLKRTFPRIFTFLKATKAALWRKILYPMLGIKCYKWLDTRDFDYIATYNPLHPSALLHNRALCVALGGYNRVAYPSDDWFFHARAAKRYLVFQIDEFLSKYRYGINASFDSETMRLGAMVNFLHIRDNMPISRRMRRILLQKHYESVLAITNKAVKMEILDFMAENHFTPKPLNWLDKRLLWLHRKGEVESYRMIWED